MAKFTEIFDAKLPSLKQDRQSKSILRKDDDNLSDAIQELSDSIILLKNRTKSEAQIANELNSLKSGFIEVTDINTEQMEESMSDMLQSLMELQNQNKTFIENNILTNKYLSDMDKRAYESALKDSESVEEMRKIKAELMNQSTDSKFFIKTMSAVRNSLERSDSVDKGVQKRLFKEIDNMGLRFHETGEVNNAAIFDIVDRVSRLTDEDGNAAVSIDSQSRVLEAVEQRVMKNIVMAAKKQGDIEMSKITLSNTQLYNHLGKTLESLDQKSRLHIEQLTESFGEGQLSIEEHTRAVSEVLTKAGKTDEYTTTQLSRLNAHLNVISKNTDPSTNKLSNAEKILQQDQMDLDRENNEKLQGLLDGISTKENVSVRRSALEGVSSAEEAGEAAVDSLFDMVGGGSKGGRRGGRFKGLGKGSKAAGLLGRFGGLARGAGGLAKGLGSTALKAAGPLAAIASTGMAAYDFFSAESGADRKKAAGSGIGGLIGGAIGVLGGPVGIAAGAALGNWLGGKVGEWFSDPEDTIPDEIKEKGPQAILNYVNDLLEPGIKESIAAGEGTYDNSDLEDLKKYKEQLRSKIDGGSSSQDDQAVASLMDQGLDNPAQIAAATGQSLAAVKRAMARRRGPGQFSTTSGHYDTSGFDTDGSGSGTVVPPTTVIQQVSGGSGGQSPDRISDESLTLLAHMV